MDLIDRQDAIDVVHYYIESGYKCDIFQELKDLPSAESERKTGKWIKDEEQSKEHTEPIFICSCCQNNSAWGTEERTRYCSFCGAKMEEEE